MAKQISHRCGKGNCEHWCSGREADSRCRIYADRRDCQKSMGNRLSCVKRNQERVRKAGGGRLFDLMNQSW